MPLFSKNFLLPDPERVAVYGTLRRGGGLHYLMNEGEEGGSTFLGELWLSGFGLYSSGGFPYAVPTFPEDKILVEVYEVSALVSRNLDSVEGVHFGHYRRDKIETPWGPSGIYVPVNQAEAMARPKIKGGDWMTIQSRHSYHMF